MTKDLRKYYHGAGVGTSATIEFRGRTVLYTVNPEYKSHDPKRNDRSPGPRYEVINGQYFDTDPEFTLPAKIWVAGYVVGDYAKSDRDPICPSTVTEFEPITDKSEIDELTTLLREKEKITLVSFPD